jgi:phosphatidate cytidylyltransferase
MGRHSSDDEAADGGGTGERAVDTLSPSGPVAEAGPETPVADAAEPPAKTSRAGRDLRSAISVGLGLGAAIVASLVLYRPSFVAVIVLAVVIGVYELVTAVAARPPLVPLLAGAVAMDVVAWYRGSSGLVIGLLITAGGVAVWRLGDGAVDYLRDVSVSVLIALYVPLLAGFAVLLAHPSDGAARVLTFIGTVVCSDTGGYASGVLFGKHPLAPRVSKAKTWEGFTGSIVACSIAGSLLVSLTFHHEWWKGIVFGVAIALTATLGDLGESMIKRDIGIKDMGRLLPGHGGVMDRLDSLLPCAAVAYLLLSWIAPT